MSHEKQGTAHDPDARGHELQGREETDWEAAYRDLRELVHRCHTVTSISNEDVMLNITRLDELKRQGKVHAVNELIKEMLKATAIIVKSVDGSKELSIVADVLVVIDRDAFRKLPC